MSNDSDDENTPPGSGPGVGGMPNNWLVPAVLLLLRDVSSYGYDLMKALTRFGFAMMNPGPLYRMLRQMEKDVLVSSSWDTSGQGPARGELQLGHLWAGAGASPVFSHRGG